MTSPRTRAVSIAFAAAGLLALAGCAADTASTVIGNDTSTSPETTSGGYIDGTYSAAASYQAPSGTESITVELTIVDDTVTAVSVTNEASDHEAKEFQSRFASRISSEVVGKDISTLDVSRVAGSSLTSEGFNAAVDDIRAQAA